MMNLSMLSLGGECRAREPNHGAKNDKEAKPPEDGGDSAGLKDGFAHFQMGQTRIREPIKRRGKPLGWGHVNVVELLKLLCDEIGVGADWQELCEFFHKVFQWG